MTEQQAAELWSRVFLIAPRELQNTILKGILERNGCQVVIFPTAASVPLEALSEPTIAPYAILTPIDELSTLTKAPVAESLLLGGTPLIAMKGRSHVNNNAPAISYGNLNLSDGNPMTHYLVGELASKEILEILCQTYSKNFQELPIAIARAGIRQR